MGKDWNGNSKSIYTTLGASNHVEDERADNDYYATEPKAVEMLCELEKFAPDIWEPCCGEGHISEVLRNNGYNVISTDLVNRGYGHGGVNFLAADVCPLEDVDIITNPPYSMAQEMVEHALSLIKDGHKVAMFLKLQFLEGKKRGIMFEKYPPKYVYVSRNRLLCAKNGDFEGMKATGGSAVAYCWYIWEKGFHGEPIVRWFN